MQTQLKTYFKPEKYINALMHDIGFDKSDEDKKEEMRQGLKNQISHLITNAIFLYVEPEQIDEAIIKYGDLEDLSKFIEKLVEISPEAQMAIIEALDNFYTETVETYEHFKQM